MAFRFWALRRWVFPYENARLHAEQSDPVALGATETTEGDPA